jgi:hypothetical protein
MKLYLVFAIAVNLILYLWARASKRRRRWRRIAERLGL